MSRRPALSIQVDASPEKSPEKSRETPKSLVYDSGGNLIAVNVSPDPKDRKRETVSNYKVKVGDCCFSSNRVPAMYLGTVKEIRNPNSSVFTKDPKPITILFQVSDTKIVTDTLPHGKSYIKTKVENPFARVPSHATAIPKSRLKSRKRTTPHSHSFIRSVSAHKTARMRSATPLRRSMRLKSGTMRITPIQTVRSH